MNSQGKKKSDSPVKAKNRYRLLGDGTVEIKLTKGKTAIIDERDLPVIRPYRWHVSSIKGGGWLVESTMCQDGKKVHLSMTHLVLAVPPGILINHKNDDTLDCRRCNLRACSRREAGQNKRTHRHSSSQYKGVSWHKGHKKWRAGICVVGKDKHLGYFDDEVAAARAYDEQAQEHFGEFARLNLPDSVASVA